MNVGADKAAPARIVATRVLHRVASKGAWAAPTLDAEIRRAGLEERDAALATEIVYGALRVLPSLDRTYESFLSQGGHRLEPLVRAALRASTYQIMHLSRVPARAAVHDAVAIVREQRGGRLGGFTNAVLRRVAAARPAEVRPPTRMNVPDWLADRLVESLGTERTEAFLSARPLPPPLGLRVRGDRDELARQIRAAHPKAEVSGGVLGPDVLLVRRGGDPRRLPGYERGRFCVQEEGAQVVGLALGATEGEHVADVCAGRGGKSVLLADAVGPQGQITALDLHEQKLEHIGRELDRLGIARERVVSRPVDLTVGTGSLGNVFDRVLVDAPCSNLGTVHRRPEILLRAGQRHIHRLAALQIAILRHAAQLVRPGGLLVYAVCSPAREEGGQVAAAFEEERAGIERLRGALPGSGVPADPDGVVRVGPWCDPAAEADAYQIVRWRLAAG